MRRALLLSTVLIATPACSTSYAPAHTGRVAITMEGGALRLYKDGKTYHPGPFGGDVDEAFAGNAQAAEEAETYQTNQTTGTVLSFAALGLELGGAGLLAASPPTSNGNGSLAPALGIMTAGVVAEIVGLIFTVSAQPHLLDAINIYNDGLQPGSRPLQPAAPAFAPEQPKP
jgi:hypothetical protein